MSLPAIFLDKDGTLVEDVPYNVDPQLLRLTPGAARGLRALHSAGYRLVIVSNQSGVARGYFTERDLLPLESGMRRMLREAGVPLAAFYYCPHHPQGSVAPYAVRCSCRKPEPGLIVRAAREHNLDLAASWMIGDILDDVEAGHRAGCRSLLLDNGHETEWHLGPGRMPDYRAVDLLEAAQAILGEEAFAERSVRRVSEPWRSSPHN